MDKNTANVSNKDIVENDTQRFLSFSLNHEIYAIPLLQAKEVIGFTATTPLPGAPAYFKGILNLRGQVISIIDLRLKLKISEAKFGPETSIIILDIDMINVGIVVDSIESVLTLEPAQMSTPPDMNSSSAKECLTGVAKIEGRLILLLDIKLILNGDDSVVLKSNRQKAA